MKKKMFQENVNPFSLKPRRDILRHENTLRGIPADTLSCCHPRVEPVLLLVSTYSRHLFKDFSVSSSSLADREGQDPASEQTNKNLCFNFQISQRKKTLFISHMYVQIKSPTSLRSSHSPFPFTPATQLTATRSWDTENGHFPQNEKAL